MTPTPKVLAGGVGGAVTIVLVWTLGLAGIDMPAVVASAVTTLATFGASFFTNDVAPEGNAP